MCYLVFYAHTRATHSNTLERLTAASGVEKRPPVTHPPSQNKTHQDDLSVQPDHIVATRVPSGRPIGKTRNITLLHKSRRDGISVSLLNRKSKCPAETVTSMITHLLNQLRKPSLVILKILPCCRSIEPTMNLTNGPIFIHIDRSWKRKNTTQHW